VASQLDISIGGVIVNRVVRGSVIIDFTISWPPDSTLASATQSVDAFAKRISEGSVTFQLQYTNGDPVSVTSIQLDNLIHKDTTTETTPKEFSTTLFIILSICLPLALACIIWGIIYTCRAQRRSPAASAYTPSRARYTLLWPAQPFSL
jgi:hypothetical protein